MLTASVCEAFLSPPSHSKLCQIRQASARGQKLMVWNIIMGIPFKALSCRPLTLPEILHVRLLISFSIQTLSSQEANLNSEVSINVLLP